MKDKKRQSTLAIVIYLASTTYGLAAASEPYIDDGLVLSTCQRLIKIKTLYEPREVLRVLGATHLRIERETNEILLHGTEVGKKTRYNPTVGGDCGLPLAEYQFFDHCGPKYAPNSGRRVCRASVRFDWGFSGHCLNINLLKKQFGRPAGLFPGLPLDGPAWTRVFSWRVSEGRKQAAIIQATVFPADSGCVKIVEIRQADWE